MIGERPSGPTALEFLDFLNQPYSKGPLAKVDQS